jgi:hypothetical protein
MGSLDIVTATHGLSGAPGLPYRLPGCAYTEGSTQPDGEFDALLPAGFPTQVQSPATWTAADLEKNQKEWIVQLTHEEADAVEHAVQAFRGKPSLFKPCKYYNSILYHLDSKMPLQKVAANTFPLPESLSQKLDQISEKCYNGLGFCILRGLKDQACSDEARAVLFAGVSAHIASTRGFQDIERKHVLGGHSTPPPSASPTDCCPQHISSGDTLKRPMNTSPRVSTMLNW